MRTLAGNGIQGELQAVVVARAELEQARARFEQAIRTAHDRGATVRSIAPAADLSPSRVHQLLSPSR